MRFMFCDLHVSLNNPSSGDINSLNLPCCICNNRWFFFCKAAFVAPMLAHRPIDFVNTPLQ